MCLVVWWGSPSHGRGHRFDTCRAHHKPPAQRPWRRTTPPSAARSPCGGCRPPWRRCPPALGKPSSPRPRTRQRSALALRSRGPQRGPATFSASLARPTPTGPAGTAGVRSDAADAFAPAEAGPRPAPGDLPPRRPVPRDRVRRHRPCFGPAATRHRHRPHQTPSCRPACPSPGRGRPGPPPGRPHDRRHPARIAMATTINPRLGRVEVAKLRASTLDGFYADLRAHGGRCQVCWARLRRGLPALRDGERYDAFRRPGAVHAGDCVAGRPLSPATIRRTHGVLSAALALARRWELVDRNPARDASPPKVRRPEVRPPAPGQVARLLAAALEADFEWAVWLRLDAVTGARRGEVCAIRRHKLDLASGELRMDRAIIHAKGADGR